MSSSKLVWWMFLMLWAEIENFVITILGTAAVSKLFCAGGAAEQVLYLGVTTGACWASVPPGKAWHWLACFQNSYWKENKVRHCGGMQLNVDTRWWGLPLWGRSRVVPQWAGAACAWACLLSQWASTWALAAECFILEGPKEKNMASVCTAGN